MRCALIVHLNGSTARSADADDKVIVTDVEEALRMGADAVSVHVNIGSYTESRQLADLGTVARSCAAWGLPLIAMVYPRGPRIDDPRDPDLLAHVANVAADLGADLVKTSVALPIDRMAEVVANCPIPVLAAGGPPDGSDLVEFASDVMASGCSGLAIGRRIFPTASPAAWCPGSPRSCTADHRARADMRSHLFDDRGRRGMKFAWIDLRVSPGRSARRWWTRPSTPVWRRRHRRRRGARDPAPDRHAGARGEGGGPALTAAKKSGDKETKGADKDAKSASGSAASPTATPT